MIDSLDGSIDSPDTLWGLMTYKWDKEKLEWVKVAREVFTDDDKTTL